MARHLIGRPASSEATGCRQGDRQDGQGPIFPDFSVNTGRKALFFLLLPLLFLGASLAPAQAQSPAFKDAGPLATDTGHLLIEWDAPGEVTLLVAKSANLADADPVYRGDYDAYFLSGLADGSYTLVLEGEGGARSEPVMLEVAHQSLPRALWLTLVGLIITLGIVIAIVKGARDD